MPIDHASQPATAEPLPGRLRALRARAEALAPNVRGALWVLLGCVLFTAMGTQVKLMSADFDSFQLAFFRAAFGLLAVIPFVVRGRFMALRTRRLGAHISRSVLGAAAMLCGFYALAHLSYADAVSLSYARPLFLIPLAVIFLGETVQARRWTATGIGFIGVLIMLRPGHAPDLATFVALGGAALVAVVTVLIKRLSQTEAPQTLLFYFGVISTLVALVPALAVWRQPTWSELAMLISIGACAALGQYCTVRSFKVGEATAVIPFDYSRLLMAGVIGYVLFAEVPDVWTLTGAAVIVASTLYIALREARLGHPPRPTHPAINPSADLESTPPAR
jgi:drug/metabolite transporter (DMT)-like permease